MQNLPPAMLALIQCVQCMRGSDRVHTSGGNGRGSLILSTFSSSSILLSNPPGAAALPWRLRRCRLFPPAASSEPGPPELLLPQHTHQYFWPTPMSMLSTMTHIHNRTGYGTRAQRACTQTCSLWSKSNKERINLLKVPWHSKASHKNWKAVVVYDSEPVERTIQL